MPAVKVRDAGRIERLIALAYFLSTRSEIHIDELCERLDIDRGQLEADLNVLMYCGLPPYSPEQLFDIFIEDDYVSMYFNDVFISPLRLTHEEKTHVLVALSKLKTQATDDAEIKAIVEVISRIDGSSSESIVVETSQSEFDAILRDAISAGSVVEITYLSLNSCRLSDRLIEPKVIYATASISYIFAFDHDSESIRVFRSDRILAANLCPDQSPVSEKEGARSIATIDESSNQIFIEQKENYVDLEIDAQASWILDSYPHDVIGEYSSIYRFYSPTPFFAARLIVANLPFVSFKGGSFSKGAILEALETIQKQMVSTLKDNEK